MKTIFARSPALVLPVTIACEAARAGFRPSYLGIAILIVLVVAIVDVLWVSFGDFEFHQTYLTGFVMSGMCLLAILPMIKAGGAVSTLIKGYVFLTVAWPALRVFNHLTFSASGAMQDDFLAAADAALGLSWVDYAA